MPAPAINESVVISYGIVGAKVIQFCETNRRHKRFFAAVER